MRQPDASATRRPLSGGATGGLMHLDLHHQAHRAQDFQVCAMHFDRGVYG
jgi:hypothetical protein